MARPRLAQLHEEIVACRACPRLVAWREEVARTKRRSHLADVYWGRPVPGFGDPDARIVIIGLAPGAHGANRTGRVFTGDRSGDFLFAGLHRAGLANQPTSTSRDDGLRLDDAFITLAGRCAPPENRPTPDELRRCSPFLDRELAALRRVAVVVALGAIAWEGYLGHLARRRLAVPKPRPRFGHGAELAAFGAPPMLGSFHVSQQNTQTGRLTPSMFDQLMQRAIFLASTSKAPG